MILVMIEGLAGSDVLTLFLFHAGNDPVEIVGNDGNALGIVGSSDAGIADGSQKLDVEPFLESNNCHDIVVF
jgi:hypothetical protein